jgi:hypothetical protein
MKISTKPPKKISRESDLQLQELIEEFEYIMYMEKLKDYYSQSKPPKKQ